MVIACPDCATIQQIPPPPERGQTRCWRCDRPLERTTGRSLDAALACAIATLLLLFTANVLPLATVHIAGLSTSTRLASGCATLWNQGWWLLALAMGVQGVILPFFRFGLLALVLGAVRLRIEGGWTGRMFRWSEALDPWAMADVFLLGGAIGYGRVAVNIPVRMGDGAYCFIAAALISMVARACLDRRSIWRRIRAPATCAGPDPISCTACDLVLPGGMDGRRCPRCAARVHRRKPFALMRAAALLIAGYLLLPVGYYYPASVLWEFGVEYPHTIFDGVKLLFEHGFAPLGLAIFCTSLCFPYIKLVGLTWFCLSARSHSARLLRTKTKLYRTIDVMGRWSYIDPFTVVVFAPMVQFGQLAHFQVGGAMPAFVAVIATSMLAARTFDPRLMWDAALDRAGACQTGRAG